MNFFDQFDKHGLLAAHRGFRYYYPENTLCAFDAAVDRCDFLEMDVRLSRDGVPVIIHDASLERTSNAAVKAAGKSLKVADWTLAELRQLDMGSWFLTTDPFSAIADKAVRRQKLQTLMPQTIMTLDEFLAWAKKKKMLLNIELKDLTDSSQALPEIVLESIDQARAGDTILISSFNHNYLRRIKELAPNQTTAALQVNSHPPYLIDYLHELGVSAYHPNEKMVTANNVAALTAAGFTVNVYTVNNRQRQQELYGFGVRAIFTDILY